VQKSSQPHNRENDALSLVENFSPYGEKEIRDSLIGRLSAVTAKNGQVSSNDVMRVGQIT